MLTLIAGAVMSSGVVKRQQARVWDGIDLIALRVEFGGLLKNFMVSFSSNFMVFTTKSPGR